MQDKGRYYALSGELPATKPVARLGIFDHGAAVVPTVSVSLSSGAIWHSKSMNNLYVARCKQFLNCASILCSHFRLEVGVEVPKSLNWDNDLPRIIRS